MRGIAALGLRGCNVTTPHKQAIFPLLDRVDDLARRIGAVNTVVVEKDGTLTGFNNDGNGFIQSLRDADPQWRPESGPIVVLGAGGAARAVVASLAAQGRDGDSPRQSHAGQGGGNRRRGRPGGQSRCRGSNARTRSTALRCSPTRPASA